MESCSSSPQTSGSLSNMIKSDSRVVPSNPGKAADTATNDAGVALIRFVGKMNLRYRPPELSNTVARSLSVNPTGLFQIQCLHVDAFLGYRHLQLCVTQIKFL
eukprot:TRINITY_DN1004_c0_g3_i4.p3 TRINITY_DN1004_c0_g3~~TRINITY_DN1004_c0_g3_i4.p3  ORF type:complete len:103 (+),score=12.14 TRINITY_DN1004_c0_g3_i4:710-1018(+)